MGHCRDRYRRQDTLDGRRVQHRRVKQHFAGWSVAQQLVQRDLAENAVPNERESIRAQIPAQQTNYELTRFDRARIQSVPGVDHSNGRARQVEFVGFHDARVLGRFASEQRYVGRLAGRGDGGHDALDTFRHELAEGDVVGHCERLGGGRGEVISAHSHEIPAETLEPVGTAGDFGLGSDAVRGHHQHGILVAVRNLEPCCKATETSNDTVGPGGSDVAAD